MVVASTSSIFILFGMNNIFTTWKNNILNEQNRPGIIYNSNGDTVINKYVSIDKTNSLHYLNLNYYNQIYKNLNNNEVEIVVIANNLAIYNKVPMDQNTETLYSAMKKSSKLEFQYGRYSQLGYGVWEYRTKGSTTWKHGTSQTKMNGHYSPYIYQNHKFASLGASNMTITAKSIYEFTYDS